MKLALVLAVSAIVLESALPWAYADDSSNQPYIDEIRKGLGVPAQQSQGQDAVPDPYIQSLKQKMKDGDSSEGYTERLKKGLQKKNEDSGSYTEQQKANLPEHQQDGAIDAVLEGKSALKARYDEDLIHSSAGIRVGAGLSNNIVGQNGVSNQSFSSVYGNGYVKDIALFYEYQPFRSKILGNFGIMASAEVAWFSGYGIFVDPELPVAYLTGSAPGTISTWPQQSQTLFQFFAIPINVSIDYRFSLLHYLQPFVSVGPSLIGYVESRNDSLPGNQGHSEAFYETVGVALLLDWVDEKARWNMYESTGIKHSYFTLQFNNMNTIAGDVVFKMDGLSAGFTFEF